MTEARHAGLDDPGLSDTILRAVGALIVVLDREGCVVRFNDACVRATGWARDEVLGRPFFELFVPQEQREGVRGVFARLSAGEFPSHFENDWLRRDGTRMTIAWSNTCTLDEGGAVSLVVGTGTDVTEQRRAEQALAAIIESTPNVAVQMFDRDGTITHWNPASARLYGWTAEETVGRRADATLFRGGGMDQLLAAFAEVEGGAAAVGPTIYRLLHRDGREVLPLSTIFCIPAGRSGRSFVCMDVDATASVRMQDALKVAAGSVPGRGLFLALTQQLGRLVGSRYALAAVLDEDGVTVRSRALVQGGQELPQLVYGLPGTPCANVMVGAVCRYEQGVADLFPRDTLLRELGIEAYLGAPLVGTNGRPLGVLVALHDQPMEVPAEKVSLVELFAARLGAELERERAEQAMQALNAELERRVAQRTTALATSNAELEAFSYSVSHDLRSPLRAVTGFAQALEEDYGAQLPPTALELLGRIRNAGARMGELIDDLLALARITRQPLKVVQVDLTALALEVGRELSQANRARTVELSVEPGLTVQADQGLMRVVLVNLLGNAWKFTSRRPTARVRVGLEQRDGRDWVLVEDDGAGFDERFAQRLFSAFQRLHSAAEFEGTGIGLATVARIVARHGGQLSAHGAVGRGATFSFHLPPRGAA